MKYYLNIRKSHKLGDSYYYHLTTSDFGGFNLILKINSKTKQLKFFDSQKPEILLGTLSLKGLEQKVKIGNINPHIFGVLSAQATRAVSLNNFPDVMDYGA